MTNDFATFLDGGVARFDQPVTEPLMSFSDHVGGSSQGSYQPRCRSLH